MSFRPTMILLKFQWLKIILKLNKLTFQISGEGGALEDELDMKDI